MRLGHSVGSNRGGEGGYVWLLVLSNLQGCWLALVGKKNTCWTDLHISRILKVTHVGFSPNISLLNCNNDYERCIAEPLWPAEILSPSSFHVYFKRISINQLFPWGSESNITRTGNFWCNSLYKWLLSHILQYNNMSSRQIPQKYIREKILHVAYDQWVRMTSHELWPPQYEVR